MGFRGLRPSQSQFEFSAHPDGPLEGRRIRSRKIRELGRPARRCFSFYGVIGLLTLAFCWKFVAEAKGKRLETFGRIPGTASTRASRA